MTAGTDLSRMAIERAELRSRESAKRERSRCREQRRLEALARIRAAHAAEIARPLIDARLVSARERKDIRARTRYAQRWSDVSQQEAIT